jgi:hypothetical protein
LQSGKIVPDRERCRTACLQKNEVSGDLLIQNWGFVAALLSPFRTQQHHAPQARRGASPIPTPFLPAPCGLCSLSLSTPMASSSSAAADVSITREQLTKYFHLPITDVAKELGICATMLKKICRKNGIPRWPHRKVFNSLSIHLCCLPLHLYFRHA